MAEIGRKSEYEKRASLADPNYKGEDYWIDPQIEKGPLSNRKCTDLFCLLIFTAATGWAGYVAYYCYHNGNPERILAPMDGDGNFCGLEQGYTEYPYLFYASVDLTWPAYGVCVKSCPLKNEPFECVPT